MFLGDSPLFINVLLVKLNLKTNCTFQSVENKTKRSVLKVMYVMATNHSSKRNSPIYFKFEV